MEIIENVALISINATLLVQLFSFLLFMWLFNRLMIRPLRRVMQEREQYVSQMRQQIVAADEAFREVAEQITRQERDVRQTALSIRGKVEAEARSSAKVVIEATKKDIDRLREESQQRVNERISETRQQMMSEAESLANQMVGALLNRRSLS